MTLNKLVERYTLQNALKFRNPQLKPILNAILSQHVDYRTRAPEIKVLVEQAILQIKDLSYDEIYERIVQKFPDLLNELQQVQEIQESRKLPTLENAKQGQLILRLPPEPSGYLHIGHAYSFYINYLYKIQYDGHLILRFEDTNPKKVELEYYDSIKDALTYLGIRYDSTVIESDHFELYSQKSRQLIEQGHAFVCLDEEETTRHNRTRSIPSKYRMQSIDQNLDLWDQMLAGMEEGKAVLRLKGDMNSPQKSIRDPTIMRIVDHPHPRTGDKFRVYPLYDFAVAIEDANVSHVLRSEEFVQKVPLQNLIRDYLGLKNPIFRHFSRLRIKNTPVSKRKIKDLIHNGIIQNWEDPRLSTVFGLRNRGIVPQTLMELVFELRLSKSQSELEWNLILAKNRKIIDKRSPRFFAAIDPIELNIEGLEPQQISLKNHPTNKLLGNRQIPTNNKFWINRSDIQSIKPETKLRLKSFLNVDIVQVQANQIQAKVSQITDHQNSRIIQWIPIEIAVPLILRRIDDLYLSSEDNQINPNSLLELKGYIEPAILDKNIYDCVQLERIGSASVVSLSNLAVILNQT